MVDVRNNLKPGKTMEEKNNSINDKDENAKPLKPRPEQRASKPRPQPRTINPKNEDLVSKFAGTKSNQKNGFWSFRKMITPILIQIVFWIGVIICIGFGSIQIVDALDSYRNREIRIITGIAWIILGPLVLRIYCEILILFFRMNETLSEIERKI